MNKKYSIQNLKCPNCANKICNAVKQIEGVQSAEIQFGNPTVLTVELNEDKAQQVLTIATQLTKRVEPNAELSEM